MSADATFSPVRPPSVPKAAKWLGAAGLLPFLAGALASLPLAGEIRPLGASLLIAYGAIILSFMGGVHWGTAMMRGDADWGPLGRSVAPALLALPAALIGGAAGLALLAAGFVGLWAYDEQETVAGRAPRWYPALRRPLTAVVAASLTIGALARFW